jgi:fatty acid amide hydrolase 2
MWASMMVDGQLSSRDISLSLANYRSHVNGYAELVRKCFRRSTHTWPSIALLILEGVPNASNKHFHRLAQQFFEEMQSLLGDNGVLFFPTFPRSAPIHGWPVVMNTLDYIYCGIFNALGLPSTQCPLGLDKQQLPLGIQCVAARGHDRLTLAVAQEIERTMGGWVSPSPLLIN